MRRARDVSSGKTPTHPTGESGQKTHNPPPTSERGHRGGMGKRMRGMHEQMPYARGRKHKTEGF